jgi:hypothetical protein
MAAPISAPYPISLEVEPALRDRNRMTCAFRIVLALPILAVAGAVGGGTIAVAGSNGTRTISAAGGLLVVAPALMILFRQKYPRWWFDWNAALLRFQNRVGAYLLLLRDEYPSTDEEQAVHLDLAYPDARTDLNRWLPLVKWFLAIPHYVVLLFLDIGLFFALIGAWFSLVFTGRYPPGIYDYAVGLMRWHNRVAGYAFILVTDRYPPFRLAP